MDKAVVFRLLALRWLEAAETVEHRGLKRCYAKRALTYQTLAVMALTPRMGADDEADPVATERP